MNIDSHINRAHGTVFAIAAMIVLAIIAKIRSLVKAEMPEGYEDSTGFHIGHK
jgi:hypothetical protein